jgi:hypothetical protein
VIGFHLRLSASHLRPFSRVGQNENGRRWTQMKTKLPRPENRESPLFMFEGAGMPAMSGSSAADSFCWSIAICNSQPNEKYIQPLFNHLTILLP